MITSVQDFEQVFTYAWRGNGPATGGLSVLSVVYEPGPAGRRWLLWAVGPDFGEFVPFEDAAEVREFARAMLDLPTAAEPYERELDFAEPEPEPEGAGPAEELCVATLSVGRVAARADEPRLTYQPYLTYQSYYWLPGRPDMTSLGLQLSCRDVDVDRLHTEARALLAAVH